MSRVYFLLFCLLHTFKCQNNTYRKEIGPNGQDTWLSDHMIPKQGTSYGSIKLGEIMSAEFDFVWLGRTNDPRDNYFENFFRVGFDGAISTSCDGLAARYP
eukprot:182150_1